MAEGFWQQAPCRCSPWQATGSELVLQDITLEVQSCFDLKYMQDYICNSLWAPAAMQVMSVRCLAHSLLAGWQHSTAWLHSVLRPPCHKKQW